MNKGLCIGGPKDGTYLEKPNTTFFYKEGDTMVRYVYVYRWWWFWEPAKAGMPGVADILNVLDAAYIDNMERKKHDAARDIRED